MFINILPSKTRLKIQFRSSLRRYCLIWGIAGACASICVAIQLIELGQANLKLAELNRRCEPLNILKREIRNDQQVVKTLQIESDALKRLQPPDHALDLLAILSGAARIQPGTLQVQRLTYQPPRRLGEAKPATKQRGVATSSPTNEFSVLNLQGVAEDDASLARFAAELRTVGVFDSVELKSSSQVAAAGGNLRQYQLECRYEDQP
jgi:Tfp pilus assembly protein PilN